MRTSRPSQISDLLGRRSQFAPIRAWLKLWAKGTPPPAYPLVVCGESGVGKSLTAELACAEAEFEPVISEAGDRDVTAIRTSFSQGRTISFFGLKRAVVVDDAMILDRRMWSEFDSVLELTPFPLVIIAITPDDVPWRVRRDALIVEIERPSSEHLMTHLVRVRDEFGFDHSESDLRAISEVASSWRAATLMLVSLPPNMRPIEKPREPTRVGHSQVRAILLGEMQPTANITVHPLALLAASEFNHADVEMMTVANSLHSRTWATELMGPVAKHYLSTLRANSTDKPPFRKREIRGSDIGRQV